MQTKKNDFNRSFLFSFLRHQSHNFIAIARVTPIKISGDDVPKFGSKKWLKFKDLDKKYAQIKGNIQSSSGMVLDT